MKKSELTAFIKEEILSTLDEDKQTQQDIKDTEELTKAIDDLAKAKKDAGIEEDASDADRITYIDIGSGYLQGFNRPHSLNKDELETLGRKIVSSLYKGNIDKAVGELTEDEDKEPSDAEIKKNKSLAKAAEELAQLTKQMKSLARKYKEVEGEEKEKIVADLKKKTKLKKELEAIINK